MPPGVRHPITQDGEDDPDDILLESQNDDKRLYTLLNVSSTASNEEILKAYRRAAVLYHPDRHSNPGSKAIADARFSDIQNAFEVLSDDIKRAHYDALGYVPLPQELQVGTANLTPSQIRDRFQLKAKERQEVEVEALVRSKGFVNAKLDARALFVPWSLPPRLIPGTDDELVAAPLWERAARWHMVSPRAFSMGHSFQVPIIRPATSVGLHGTTFMGPASASTRLLVIGKHRLSPQLDLETSFDVLGNRRPELKAVYTPDPDAFITCSLSTKSFLGLLTVGQRVTEHVTAFFTIKGPLGSPISPPQTIPAFSLGATSAKGWNLSSEVTRNSTSVSFDHVWTPRFLGFRVVYGFVASAQPNISVRGVALSASSFVRGEGHITSLTRLSAGVNLNLNGTTTLTVAWSRLGQRVSIPVLVADFFDPWIVLGLVAFPTLSAIGMGHWVVRPYKRRRVERRLAELQQQAQERLASIAAEAQETVRLMNPTVERRIAAEQAEKGLVITSAYYGS